MIYQKDLEDGNVLAIQPALDSSLLYTIEEIAILVEELIEIDSPRDSSGRLLEVRPKGNWFEFEVAKCLGYNYPPSSGLFPDIRHQILEIKHHTGKSITVDFGRHHPGSEEIINETWNQKLQIKVNQVRYLIALAPPPTYKISTLILLTGAEIIDVFGVSPKATIKYQMGISKKWCEEYQGKILVGQSIWL
ncbi:hypothetical protein [Okeania sp.]|uniref:hypothetical protein n=1 Tax=Okeania sp. TaxID=3100323 RepID=UPI002B4B8654|nr:hypothetical protein [Okeania sp.]MEB3341514.1 hypothetical protein [Okeania sp.]